MTEAAFNRLTVQQVANEVAAALVSVRHWGESSFIKMPLVYPSGEFVMLKLSPVKDGFRVSDGGLAYREAERFGAERSVPNTVRKLIEGKDLSYESHVIFADVAPHEVEAALYEVAIASYQTAEQIVLRAAEVHAEDIAEALQERLQAVFGVDKVTPDSEVVGSSATKWKVSAIAKTKDHLVVFQAVSDSPMSLYRTSAAFHDLFLLDDAPKLVAVVESKAKLDAHKLGLLTQAGSLIELGQSDAVYLRAAA